MGLSWAVDNPISGGWSVGGAWLSWVMEATTATTTTVGNLDSPAEVLAFARERRAAADRAEAELVQAAVVWADPPTRRPWRGAGG
jgi:hypothetical protein